MKDAEALHLDFDRIIRFADYELQYTNAHEYDGLNGGIARTWREVSEMNKGKEQKIFSEYPGRWMGIGCILPISNAEEGQSGTGVAATTY